MSHTVLTIEGMSCDHCVRGVRQALESLAGVEVERVEIGSARVAHDPERADPGRIRKAVEAEGYAVRAMETSP